MSPYVLLLLFMVGLAIYVRLSEVVCILENDDEYNTLRHELLVNLSSVGLCISLACILSLVLRAEKQIKDNENVTVDLS